MHFNIRNLEDLMLNCIIERRINGIGSTKTGPVFNQTPLNCPSREAGPLQSTPSLVIGHLPAFTSTKVCDIDPVLDARKSDLIVG